MALAIGAGSPSPEGHWLVANRQIAGRGRLGRKWFDGQGNFMGSTCVEVREGDPPPHSLTLLAACAVRETVAQCLPTSDKLFIKWPNDVLYDGAKLAGILLERTNEYIVVGIGVNLAVAPELADRKTTSLRTLGVAVDREIFAENLAKNWVEHLEEWREGGAAAVIANWLNHAHPLGTILTISEGLHAGLTGSFDGLEADGALRLRTNDGRISIIHAGDVSMYAETKE